MRSLEVLALRQRGRPSAHIQRGICDFEIHTVDPQAVNYDRKFLVIQGESKSLESAWQSSRFIFSISTCLRRTLKGPKTDSNLIFKTPITVPTTCDNRVSTE